MGRWTRFHFNMRNIFPILHTQNGVRIKFWQLLYSITAVHSSQCNCCLMNRACHPTGHYWNYYPGIVSLKQSPWWRHQMEIFFRVTGHLCGEFTGHRDEAGDLRRYHAHYDVIVMWNELQRFDYMAVYQDSSHRNGRQATSPISSSLTNISWLTYTCPNGEGAPVPVTS